MGVARAAVVACLSTVGLLVAGVLVPGPADADSGPARILLVGDSVTQGRAGDYTWRYRLWKTLQTRAKAVDFVGPRQTLADDSTHYADADFDRDHAARWGAMMISDGWWVSPFPKDDTQELVGTYAPDVVIDDLGVNNLLYGGTPEQVIALAESFVADVRAARPGATIVLGQLTQRWVSGVDAYNSLLVDLVAGLDQPGARVLLAPVPADYTIDDTYDTSHPNVQGEIKIARQFADVLATLPLPDKPAPVAPAFGGAAHLAAAARNRAVRLTFSTPDTATRQAVWKRDLTRRGPWRFVAYVEPTAVHRRVGSLRPHHRYAYRLRAYRGSVASSSYSNLARARAR
jgi:hypothetical protein